MDSGYSYNTALFLPYLFIFEIKKKDRESYYVKVEQEKCATYHVIKKILLWIL